MCKVAEGLTVERILENWMKIKPIIMAEWDENREELIDLFGKVRDEWMDNDLATWIGANRYFLVFQIICSIPSYSSTLFVEFIGCYN